LNSRPALSAGASGNVFSPAIAMNLTQFIRAVPDFPKPGILFRDITPLLGNPQAFGEAIRQLAEHYRGQKIDVVAAAEARGFIFAAPLALELGVGFVPVRKPGKLPFDTHAFHYELEYGTDTLEIHRDGIAPEQHVLLVDDLLATGGTIEACCRLVEKANATVAGCAFLIELGNLGGAERLAPYNPFSLIRYE
jgi:adenine phosphoribosyltransferase